MRSKKQPLVSVIMPVYNYEEYLSIAIQSILDQTYPNFEFIIVDDASTDGSFEIINGYQKKYPQIIKIIKLKKNLNHGGDMCANEGIKRAKGKYIARMDADDIALPTRLEKQIDFLENNPDIFLVGSNAFVIDEEGSLIGEKTQPLSNKKIYENYFIFHPIIHSSSVYRNELKNKEKFQYKIAYKSNNDYYTFLRLMCNGYKFTNLKEKLVYYRIHGKSDTFRRVKRAFFNILRIRLNIFLHHGYKLTAKDFFVNLAELIAVSVLPKKTVVDLYLLSKGILKRRFTPSLFQLALQK